MPGDDYHVITFKVLTYLYAVVKRKITFDEAAFHKAIGAEYYAEGYKDYVLRNMIDEGLITGLTFKKVWRSEYIIVNTEGEAEAEITPKGITYLQENSKMKNVKNHLTEAADFIAPLIKMVFD